jgi:(R,R)-butanediol dehydrogenase/meso-butanediol dehydrogenase/diacetyl reductase
MRVGLVTGLRQVEIREMPEPVPEPGKAVVEIGYCGICGTDIHAYQSGQPYNPAICGHEWAGTVTGVGSGVARLREGDRVAIGVATACGQCGPCRHGNASHCELAFLGSIGAGPMAAPHGGFATSICFDAARLYHVPNSISDIDAAILEPATVAVHALRRTPIRLGDTAVIIGGGPIGLLTMQAARAAGAGTVVLIEPEPSRRQMAASLGADVVLDPKNDDVNARLSIIVGAAGPDIVFECAGVPQTIQQAVSLVRRGGVVSLVGVANSPATIQPGEWLIKEVRLLSSVAYVHEDFEIAKDLVAYGRIQVAPLHTSTTALSNLAGAFDKLAQNPKEVKILVDPRA